MWVCSRTGLEADGEVYDEDAFSAVTISRPFSFVPTLSVELTASYVNTRHQESFFVPDASFLALLLRGIAALFLRRRDLPLYTGKTP